MQPRKRIWVAYLAIQICFVSPRICFSFWHAMPPFTLWKRGALWSHVRSKGTGLGFTRMASIRTHVQQYKTKRLYPGLLGGRSIKVSFNLLPLAMAWFFRTWPNGLMAGQTQTYSKLTRLLFFLGFLSA